MATSTGDSYGYSYGYDGEDVIESEANASAMTINMAETVKANNYMVSSGSSKKSRRDEPSKRSEAPNKKLDTSKIGQTSARTAEGLRRQPTKYPHGLNVNIQTVSAANEQHQHQHINGNNNSSNSSGSTTIISSSELNSNYGYSRASTLRSSWDGNKHSDKQHRNHNSSKVDALSTSLSPSASALASSSDNSHRKYRISMISSPENLAELQMRRYKYPLTGNYYLDTQDVTSAGKHPPPLPVLRTYLQRFGRWKYLRWPIIFVASTLLFFGLITYCIWLHDVSVVRERYQRRRQELGKEAAQVVADNEAQLISFVVNTLDASSATTTLPTTTNVHTVVTTDRNQQHLQESTILRAINTQAHQPPTPNGRKLTTFKYVLPTRGVVAGSDGQRKRNGASTEQEEDETPSEATTYASAEAALVPTNVLHYNGFNGHQNSFGVPIEEGHRLLRLFNKVLSPDQPFTLTTKSITKVSPTIPPLVQYKPTHAMSSGFRTTAQDNGCHSTALSMCQGVLDYDLTYNSTTKLQLNDKKAFQTLVESNCSARALEFVCVTLEPECRPSHIGILPPCRRICKAVLEACSIVIANWDVLNELFDCSLYPDTSDPHKCEDPTRRRDYCYDNEFACYDRTCIPQQWQCDNIKDCAAGEDEESCLICDHQDEFRCRSNEKCVPESVRCDSKYDCFDGSDEEECDEYGSGEEAAAIFDEAALNSFPRVFSYASFLSPNQSNEGLYTYITAATDDENGTIFQVHEITNRTSGISTEEVTNSVPGEGPKGFVNFRDSKEIMMTSDTENKFKYSSTATTSRLSSTTTNRSVHGSSSSSSNSNRLYFGATTPLKPAASMRIAVTTEPSSSTDPTNDDTTDNANTKHPALLNTCAPHQLRCVSGECITVNQLCDKKMDCPDGADELMCIYKEQRSSSTTTTTTTTTTIRSNTDNKSPSRSRSVRTQTPATAITTVRTADKRSLTRTTIKRKVKP